MEFISIGHSDLSKELFRNILDFSFNNSKKPIGGLWACAYDSTQNFNPSPWLNYLIEEFDSRKFNHEGIIFKLKDTSSILIINSPKSLLDAKRRYCIGDKLDYEKMELDYDGIYVDVNKLNYDTIFKGFDINSLLLFNIDCIEYYHKIYLSEMLPNAYTLCEEDENDTHSIMPYSDKYKLLESKIGAYLKKKEFSFLKSLNDCNNIIDELLIEFENDSLFKCVYNSLLKIDSTLTPKNLITTIYLNQYKICKNKLKNKLLLLKNKVIK